MASTTNTRRWSRRFVTIVAVALALSTVSIGGSTAQQTDSPGSETFVAVQDGECTPLAPVSGNESAREFYDYRVEDPDNPYINTTGDSYASEGTRALQRPDTSVIFLYTDTNGTNDTDDDTTSLVTVHGNEGNRSSDGGYATFNITGLPENGTWVVKDDDYDDDQSWDDWSTDTGYTVVDWAWSAASADGGVYAGLDGNTSIVVNASFNEDATFYENDYYDGTVERWELLSNESDDIDRLSLDPDEPLAIAAASCDAIDDGSDVETGADDTDGNGDVTGTETPIEDTPAANESASP